MTVKQTGKKPARVGDGTPGPGRPKGSPNKATAKRQREIRASGIDPLDYMLSVFRDVTRSAEERLKAAIAAVPYVHARLSSVEAMHSGSVDLLGTLKSLPE